MQDMAWVRGVGSGVRVRVWVGAWVGAWALSEQKDRPVLYPGTCNPDRTINAPVIRLGLDDP